MSSEPQVVSEAASEKRKRGRPRVIGPEVKHVIDFMSDATTARGRQDAYYRLMAMTALKDDPRFYWLTTDDGSDTWRPSILTELGRISDTATMTAVALRVCELRPKTKDAVAMIRRFRLGRAPEGTAAGLDERLVRAVNEYWHGHAGITPAETVEVLRALADRIEVDHVCDE